MFLGALAAGFALDPERALWTPGRKLISIPRTVAAQSFDYVGLFSYDYRTGQYYEVMRQRISPDEGVLFRPAHDTWRAVSAAQVFDCNGKPLSEVVRFSPLWGVWGASTLRFNANTRTLF
jgi:hypothetical protein